MLVCVICVCLIHFGCSNLVISVCSFGCINCFKIVLFWSFYFDFNCFLRDLRVQCRILIAIDS